jgi:hypothetical protein
MQNRIYIPVFVAGALVGWQGRLDYDPPKGGPPKYFTMPGMPTRTSGWELLAGSRPRLAA